MIPSRGQDLLKIRLRGTDPDWLFLSLAGRMPTPRDCYGVTLDRPCSDYRFAVGLDTVVAVDKTTTELKKTLTELLWLNGHDAYAGPTLILWDVAQRVGSYIHPIFTAKDQPALRAAFVRQAYDRTQPLEAGWFPRHKNRKQWSLKIVSSKFTHEQEDEVSFWLT